MIVRVSWGETHAHVVIPGKKTKTRTKIWVMKDLNRKQDGNLAGNLVNFSQLLHKSFNYKELTHAVSKRAQNDIWKTVFLYFTRFPIFLEVKNNEKVSPQYCFVEEAKWNTQCKSLISTPGKDTLFIINISLLWTSEISTVEALVSGHPQDAKKVSVTGAGRLREWFSQAATRGVGDRWPLTWACPANNKYCIVTGRGWRQNKHWNMVL